MADSEDEVPATSTAEATTTKGEDVTDKKGATSNRNSVEVKSKKGCCKKGTKGEVPIIKCIVGEFVGTVLLVFLGCASCIKNDAVRDPNLPANETDCQSYESRAALQLQIALAFGISVATIAQAIGHISGCHLNPAVTFGLMVSGDCPPIKGMFYVVTQLCASMLAVSMLYILNYSAGIYNEPVYDPPYGPGPEPICYSSVPLDGFTVVAAILNEFIITFLLVLTVCGVCDNLRKDVKGSAPLAIGLAVFLGHIVGIRYSGASMNPARSFGPMIIGSMADKHTERVKSVWMVCWVYWLGPCGGGVTAGALYRFVFKLKPAPAGDSA